MEKFFSRVPTTFNLWFLFAWLWRLQSSSSQEMNPDVQFLQVNYEEHKSMCYSLNVHVYNCVCSFSCTNATIKKFKDPLAKYSPDRCSLGEPKGLEEEELVALSANRDLELTYEPKLPKHLCLLEAWHQVVLLVIHLFYLFTLWICHTSIHVWKDNARK